MRRIVDLPQPDGPSRAITSLGRTFRLMSSRTRRGLPLGSRKSCQTPRTSHRVAVAGGAAAVCAITVPFAPGAGPGPRLLVQREALLCHIIETPPNQTVE